MNLIQQHMENVSREEAQLEERAIRLKAEQDETRKLLNNIRRYRKSLNKQYPSSQATLPLAPPPDDEEEEATDESVDFAKAMEDTDDSEPLVPGERSPEYETSGNYEAEKDADAPAKEWEAAHFGKPADTAEPEKPIRRRKAKATAEE